MHFSTSKCIKFRARRPASGRTGNTIALQTGSDWSIKRLESRWPMQGCCSTSFIINSLLYWLCIHLEGKRRRADVWGCYISRHLPPFPLAYLPGAEAEEGWRMSRRLLWYQHLKRQWSRNELGCQWGTTHGKRARGKSGRKWKRCAWWLLGEMIN